MPTTFKDEMKPAVPATPGPWRYLRHDGVIVHDRSDYGAREIAWNDADYMLAAAAPELLVALRGLLKHLESWKTIEVSGGWIQIAREAITKAEGR